MDPIRNIAERTRASFTNLFSLIMFVPMIISAISILKYELFFQRNPTIFIYGEYGEYFQGDMNLTKNQKNQIFPPLFRSIQENTGSYQWPENKVYYDISAFDKQHAIMIISAMKKIESISCVGFYQYNPNVKDYVLFTNQMNGCYSNVGHIGGRQILNLEENSVCFNEGVIIHELLHTLGFHHQHCAYNRDKFIKINWINIKPRYRQQFIKYLSEEIINLGFAYDYGSIMHFKNDAYSRNNLPTITPINSNYEIGQRIAMSSIDIKKINVMYNCT